VYMRHAMPILTRPTQAVKLSLRHPISERCARSASRSIPE